MPVKDIPLYGGTSHESALWKTFNTIITLDRIFHQQGNNISHVTFKNIVQNIRNENPTIDDYNILMSHTHSFLLEDEIHYLHDSMHLFPTNSRTTIHITRSIVENDNTYSSLSSEDEYLE